MFGIGKNKTADYQEKRFSELEELIKQKFYISSEIADIKVDWSLPENFIELSDEFCTGEIKWRRYRVDLENKKISADNNWKPHSSIVKHKHVESYETITTINGSGYIVLYNDAGLEQKKVHLKEKESITIKPNKIHSAYCDEEWDIIVNYKGID
mgnify:CR=1 FL=1